jgi:hypothetical protein
MNEGIVFDSDAASAVTAVTASLLRRGLYVVRSFDLRSALAAHPECTCPHHGTAECTCQLVVLLVYAEDAGPAVVTLHTHEARTQAKIVRGATTQPDPRLVEPILRALFEAALAVQLTPAPATETAHAD